VAWLGFLRQTLSKLKRSVNTYSKMSDRVSRNIFGAQVLLGLSREGCIEVYIDNRRIFIVVYYIECLTRVQAMLMERGVGGKTMV
jgi:hypothetical protein